MKDISIFINETKLVRSSNFNEKVKIFKKFKIFYSWNISKSEFKEQNYDCKLLKYFKPYKYIQYVDEDGGCEDLENWEKFIEYIKKNSKEIDKQEEDDTYTIYENPIFGHILYVEAGLSAIDCVYWGSDGNEEYDDQKY